MAGGKLSGGDVGLFVLRLALGGIFMAHGIWKLVPPNTLQGFADSVSGLGIPAGLPPYPLAVAALAAEIGGGFLVIIGLFPRIAALSIAGVMAVAIWGVHWKNGFWLVGKAPEAGFEPNAHIPHGVEFCVALLAMALCVTFAGAGKLAIGPKVLQPKKKPQ
jgi:putative oxidoreductase